MSTDLDAFSVKSEDVEVDPAAEFLAREQDALAGLEDDFEYNGTIVDEAPFLQDNGETVNGIDSDHSDSNGSSRKLSTGSHGKGSAPAPPIVPSEPKPEPEKIKKWREEQQRILEQKDEEEAERKEELRLQAKKELEEWYNRYAEQLEKSKLNNRNAEKEWIAERDAETPGLEWEKIARMCDFNPKSARNTKDTSRMRSILLQLKQSPPASSR